VFLADRVLVMTERPCDRGDLRRAVRVRARWMRWRIPPSPNWCSGPKNTSSPKARWIREWLFSQKAAACSVHLAPLRERSDCSQRNARPEHPGEGILRESRLLRQPLTATLSPKCGARERAHGREME